MSSKIVIIANYAPSVIRFWEQLIRAFQDEGLEVSVIVPASSGRQQVEAIEAMGCACFVVPMDPTGKNFFKDILLLRALYKCLSNIRPNYVLAYTIKPVIYGLIAARLAGIKDRLGLITGVGSAFLDDSLKGHLLLMLIKLQYRFALKSAKTVIFQNRDDKAEFVNEELVNESQAFLVNGSGVDLDYYSYSPPFISEDQCTFLMLSRLLKDKGIYELVEAARIVKKIHPKVRVLLAGDVDKNPSSIQISEVMKWQEEGVLEYLGPLEDVRPAIKESSVYVLPSYREGASRSVLEGMAMGRPIITTDVPGCRQMVEDGLNGFLVPAKSGKALATAMLKFIQEPELITKMGLASRRIAEEKYDVHKVNQAILDILWR